MADLIKLSKEREIETYTPTQELQEIIKMTSMLGRPLLLAGKPGTGKTQFAYWYASKKSDYNDVFLFNTKSTSIYNDLFYEYDAVSHFRDKNGEKDVTDFITLTALGKAIVCAKGIDNIIDDKLTKIIKRSNLKFDDKKLNSIVLIDEIDKAPRDFPNDLLHEIENLSFTIKEVSPGVTISLNDDEKMRVTIILTSNDEKNLPDAFLRRCLFHYIEFPNKENLKEIILKKLNLLDSNELENKLDFFQKIYESKSIEKKPSTSECIDWINYLSNKNLLDKPLDKIQNSLSILLKKKEDLEDAKRILNTNL